MPSSRHVVKDGSTEKTKIFATKTQRRKDTKLNLRKINFLTGITKYAYSKTKFFA